MVFSCFLSHAVSNGGSFLPARCLQGVASSRKVAFTGISSRTRTSDARMSTSRVHLTLIILGRHVVLCVFKHIPRIKKFKTFCLCDIELDARGIGSAEIKGNQEQLQMLSNCNLTHLCHH
jgi:hypothetical protein